MISSGWTVPEFGNTTPRRTFDTGTAWLIPNLYPIYRNWSIAHIRCVSVMLVIQATVISEYIICKAPRPVGGVLVAPDLPRKKGTVAHIASQRS